MTYRPTSSEKGGAPERPARPAGILAGLDDTLDQSRFRHPPEIEQGDFLTVSGIVGADGSLSVEPGFRVDRRESPGWTELTEAALRESLVVEFLNAGRELLSQHPIPMSPLCGLLPLDTHAPATLEAPARIFAASVPFAPETEYVRYYVAGALVKELANTNAKLRVRFDRTPGDNPGGIEEVRWRLTGVGEANVRSVLMYSRDDGATWQPISPPERTTSVAYPVDFGQLAGGQGRLRVVATDGFTTVSADTRPFQVAEKGARPLIISVADGAAVPSGAAILLVGQGYHYERDTAVNDELVWSVGGIGEVGRGATASVVLSPGYHEISLTCVDATTSVTVRAGLFGQRGDRTEAGSVN